MLIILILSSNWLGFSCFSLGPVIEITGGAIRGKVAFFEDIYYYAYLGIPYAESPTGDLRFKPPVPKQSWKGIRDATTFGPVCPQTKLKYNKEQMNEDCLFLNVYVPMNTTKEPKAVLVFIHGGAFHWISGNSDVIYGPDLLMQKDIIFVTMNFRLGVLGFLTLDIEEASGNAGMKDIVLSLEWVKQNIARFGGDPQRITIGGHSSGAAAVHLLMLSHKSRGLFQSAILISGSAFNNRFIMNHKNDIVQAFIQELGLVSQDKYEILELLKKFDPFEMAQKSFDILKDYRNELDPTTYFVPCIEIDYPDAFLTKSPEKIMRDGMQHNVSILVGFNAQESYYVYSSYKGSQYIDKIPKNIEKLIPSDINYPLGSQESINLAKSILKFYFGDDTSSLFKNTPNWKEKLIDVLSDIQYNYSVDSWIKLYKEMCENCSLYYYMFDFNGQLNWSRLNYGLNYTGTAHADELGYIFTTQQTAELLTHVNNRSKNMMDIILITFTNFIKYSNPTPESSPFQWPESGTNRNHLVLSENPSSRLHPPYESRIQFWDNVYDQYRTYLQNGGRTVLRYIP